MRRLFNLLLRSLPVATAVLVGILSAADVPDEWKQKAAQGDAAAQCDLGLAYELGRGVTQDASKPLVGIGDLPSREMRMLKIT